MIQLKKRQNETHNEKEPILHLKFNRSNIKRIASSDKNHKEKQPKGICVRLFQCI
jgi:hypothetical protein